MHKGLAMQKAIDISFTCKLAVSIRHTHIDALNIGLIREYFLSSESYLQKFPV